MEAAGVSGRAQSARPRSGAGRRRCRTRRVRFERAEVEDRAIGAKELLPTRDAEDAATGGTGGTPAAAGVGAQPSPKNSPEQVLRLRTSESLEYVAAPGAEAFSRALDAPLLKAIGCEDDEVLPGNPLPTRSDHHHG